MKDLSEMHNHSVTEPALTNRSVQPPQSFFSLMLLLRGHPPFSSLLVISTLQHFR